MGKKPLQASNFCWVYLASLFSNQYKNTTARSLFGMQRFCYIPWESFHPSGLRPLGWNNSHGMLQNLCIPHNDRAITYFYTIYSITRIYASLWSAETWRKYAGWLIYLRLVDPMPKRFAIICQKCDVGYFVKTFLRENVNDIFTMSLITHVFTHCLVHSFIGILEM